MCTKMILLMASLFAALLFQPSASAVGWPIHCVGCERNTHGSIKRSAAARKQFMSDTKFPKGRKGYVVDHIIPLACAADTRTSTAAQQQHLLDSPNNMQWQTKGEAKVKDTWEMQLCDPATRQVVAASHHQRLRGGF